MLITTKTNDATVQKVESENLSSSEKTELYKKTVVQKTRLHSFNQFVFLQHFLLTFDERRHLLFWDEKVCEQVLFLAFGVDYEESQQADTLRRQIERTESKIRNDQWQATQARLGLQSLNADEALLAGLRQGEIDDDFQRTEEKFLALVKQETDLIGEVNSIDMTLKSIDAKVAELSSQKVFMQQKYEDTFANAFKNGGHLKSHPFVANMVQNESCTICGSSDAKIKERVLDQLSKKLCPICGCNTSEPSVDANIKELESLDKDLSQKTASLYEVLHTRDTQTALLVEKTQALFTARSSLETMERENMSLVQKVRAKNSGTKDDFALLKESYAAKIQDHLAKKAANIVERDKSRKKLDVLHNKLEQSYAAAEGLFVPEFIRLSKMFLGLDISVRLNRVAAGARLILDVRDQVRSEPEQLSESQRFFIDIALRMALAKYMSQPTARPTLFIDTPEGSLDIAYESRAGAMFAMFAEDGQNIFMTANINSSNLLTSLARKCKRRLMQLVRMTSWADLSQVQQEEEALFNDAFEHIEQALLEEP